MNQQVIHCGPPPVVASANCTLNPSRPGRDVILDLSGIEVAAGHDLLPIVRDLVLVSAYLLLADGAITRGRKNDPLATRWRRDLFLHIPVSDPHRWNGARGELIELLEFATDDSWAFDFRLAGEEQQLTLNLASTGDESPTCVALFSGGLDSLAGALRLVDSGERPVLASHWTTESGRTHREAVVGALRTRKPGWRFPNPSLHTVRAREAGDAAEYTQRSRGILYLSLGVGVALQAGLERLVIAENAVTSLNLEQSRQSVGAMRSRTTHPKTISLFRGLLSRLGIDVSIDTPFFDCTKGEVAQEAIARGGEDLAHLTVSCARGLFATREQPHCGTCSQCVDRRFAGVWAGWNDATEVTQHSVDLFRDSLQAGEAATYAEQYIRFATDVLNMSVDAFVSQKDVFRAVEDADDPASELRRIHAVVRRHSEQVDSAFSEVWRRNHRDLLAGRLPADGLLARIGRLDYRKPDWTRCADRIVEVLEPALRKQFATSKPASEAELQVAIDALQTAARINLQREFPTVSFALIGTRPDFSAWANPDSPEPDLFVEVKLIRARREVTSVTDELLADIPKYTARARKALLLVYDTGGFIADDGVFATPLEELGEVRVAVLRQ